MNDKDKKQWIFSPGISNLEIDEREVYENLSREDKILAEIQIQTRDIMTLQAATHVKTRYIMTLHAAKHAKTRYIMTLHAAKHTKTRYIMI